MNKKNNIDNVKDYWNNRPCNIRHSNSPVGTKEYFEQVSERKYKVEPHIKEFSGFKNWKGKKVLEVGCGIGTTAVSFAQNGANYTGIELSEESLNLTRQRFETYGLNGHFYLGNAEKLSSIVPVEKYDLIYSFGVIHHSPNPDKIVDEVKKYMSTNSEFRLMLYAKNSWKNIMINAELDQPEAQSGCPIAFTYTHDEIRSLLKDYNIVEISQDHIFPYIIEKYIKYEYELEPWFNSMSQEMIDALNKALGWHTLVKAKQKTLI